MTGSPIFRKFHKIERLANLNYHVSIKTSQAKCFIDLKSLGNFSC